MKPNLIFLLALATGFWAQGRAQDTLPAKVSHVEPLYMDLVRDLGARKGEKEWNLGLSLEDKTDYHSLGGLVEYEFAPANRWGVELEIPFSVHFKTDRRQEVELPSSGIDGIKVATQYTFFVSPRYQLSLAAGYANDLELHAETHAGKWRPAPENVSQPFFVLAKSWRQSRFHTLLYTATTLGMDVRTGRLRKELLVNTNFHYRFPRSRNMVGVEVNQTYGFPKVDIVLRPQAKVNLGKGLALGVVVSIPVLGQAEGTGLFCRLIYEPSVKKNRP